MNNVHIEIMYVTFYNFVSDWNDVHKRQDEAFNFVLFTHLCKCKYIKKGM